MQAIVLWQSDLAFTQTRIGMLLAVRRQAR